METAARFIEAVRRLKRSGAMLLHGHRGSGKTSALRKIEAMVSSTLGGAVVVEIPLRGKSSESALLRDIVQEIERFVSEGATRVARFKAAVEKIRSLGISLMGAGLTVSSASPETLNPITLWRKCVASLAGSPCVCVCVDDAEQLDKVGLGTLKTIAESVAETPVLLVVAGGPELMKRLSDPDASPVARAFSGATFDLEEFTAEETKEALDAPLRSSGATGRWSEDAVLAIWRLAHGYPYLVKCLAQAAYREGRLVNSTGVQETVQEALDVAASWLEREIPHASDVDIRTFAKIAQTGKGSLKSAEILELGVQSPYIGRLVRLGVLKKVARGHYELRKAPVIAYYHMLRRGLAGA